MTPITDERLRELAERIRPLDWIRLNRDTSLEMLSIVEELLSRREAEKAEWREGFVASKKKGVYATFMVMTDRIDEALDWPTIEGMPKLMQKFAIPVRVRERKVELLTK